MHFLFVVVCIVLLLVHTSCALEAETNSKKFHLGAPLSSRHVENDMDAMESTSLERAQRPTWFGSGETFENFFMANNRGGGVYGGRTVSLPSYWRQWTGFAPTGSPRWWMGFFTSPIGLLIYLLKSIFAPSSSSSSSSLERNSLLQPSNKDFFTSQEFQAYQLEKEAGILNMFKSFGNSISNAAGLAHMLIMQSMGPSFYILPWDKFQALKYAKSYHSAMSPTSTAAEVTDQNSDSLSTQYPSVQFDDTKPYSFNGLQFTYFRLTAQTEGEENSSDNQPFYSFVMEFDDHQRDDSKVVDLLLRRLAEVDMQGVINSKDKNQKFVEHAYMWYIRNEGYYFAFPKVKTPENVRDNFVVVGPYDDDGKTRRNMVYEAITNEYTYQAYLSNMFSGL